MNVQQLIEMLEEYDKDLPVRIGMQQTYGSDFAMNVTEVGVYGINSFYGKDYLALVLTEGSQCGTVDYDGDMIVEE